LTKETPNDHPIHDLIKNRWSPTAFSSKRVEGEKLLSLFEAARWAPSAFNAQPWYFIVATQQDGALFEKILDCLKEGNQAWARNAPVLMLSLMKNYLREDLEKPNQTAQHDVGLAVENLVLEAKAHDLYAHQMGGIYHDKIIETFNLPAGHEAIAAIALGYLGDPNELPEDRRERELRPRERKPISEFVFGDGFGNTSKLVE
jgi:nitroreductase